MPVIASEISLNKSLVINESGTNGGSISGNAIVSGLSANIFPDVFDAERISGSTKYRKVFYKINNVQNIPFYNARAYIESGTPGDDFVVLFAGTPSNTAANFTGSERLYGAALTTGVLAPGAVSAVVTQEVDAVVFVAGDVVRISDKATIDAVAGAEEFATVSNVTGTGLTRTLTLSALANGYTSGAKVSSVLPIGNMSASMSGFGKTSVAGTFNTGTYPVAPHGIGSVDDTWTLTFTSPTAFNISSTKLGAVGSGSISANVAPVNAAMANYPYFSINPLTWGGTWALGDTVTFTTAGAVASLWLKRVVPANATATPGNRFVLVIDGESA